MIWLLLSLFMSYEYKASWFVRGLYGWDFAIEDTLLFATSAYGVDIFNVVDAAHPTLISSIMTPGLTFGVDVNHNLLCICDDYAGVRIFDIGNPALPMELGHLDSPGLATMIVIRDTIAYLADDWCGLRIINISDPSSPVEIGSYDTPGRAIWLDVADTLVYLSDDYKGLVILNVRDPTNPQVVGNWINPNLSYVWTVDVIDTLLYVSGEYLVVPQLKHFFVLNVSNPATPIYISGVSLPEPPFGFMILDTIAFVCDQSSGVRVINIANPLNMYEITHIPGFHYYNPTGSDSLLFTAYSSYGTLNDNCIKIYNVSKPDSIAPIGQYFPGPFILDVALDGNTLFLLATKEYTQVMAFNCTEPESILLIDSLTLIPVSSFGYLYYDHPYIFVGHGGHWSIVEFINNSLQFRSTVNTPAEILVRNNNYLFTGNGSSDFGFRAYDISNPFSPQIIDSLPIRCRDIVIIGPYAYAIFSELLYVIKIEDPHNLSVICSLNTGHDSKKIVKCQSYLIIGNQDWCLQIVDISQPTNPQIVNVISTPYSENYDLVMNDSLLFVASRVNVGIHFYNITNPVMPILVDSCDTPAFACNIAVGHDYLFVADWLCLGLIKGLSPGIAEHNGSATIKIHKIYPNPFSDCLNIEMISPQEQNYGVIIYDVLGRLVRNINEISIGAIPHIIWDGRDEAQRPVPPGVYFIQIINTENRKTKINKVVKIN